MTGLEKIVEQIKQEALAASDNQLAETRKEAEKILNEAKSKREIDYKKALEQVDADTKQLLLRGQSAAQLQERKLLLSSKQQIIKQIFQDASKAMLQLELEKYFELLLHMVDRYALQENGCIHLSKYDLDRMPDSFHMELDKRSITISNEPAQLNGGFILSYGEIEENCSFDTLIESNREYLQDKIVELIF